MKHLVVPTLFGGTGVGIAVILQGGDGSDWFLEYCAGKNWARYLVITPEAVK
jgi:hypothetical protein